MTTKTKKTTKQGVAEQAAPCFYKEQLFTAFNVSLDIVRALLEDGRRYTVAEAREIINNYLNRKV